MSVVLPKENAISISYFPFKNLFVELKTPLMMSIGGTNVLHHRGTTVGVPALFKATLQLKTILLLNCIPPEVAFINMAEFLESRLSNPIPLLCLGAHNFFNFSKCAFFFTTSPYLVDSLKNNLLLFLSIAARTPLGILRS